MTQRPTHVPRFGDWDPNEHIPFTAVFDHARAGKGGGKVINPNDPSENPAAFGLGNDDPDPQPLQPKPERRSSNEVGHNRPSWEQRTGLPTHRPSGDAQEYQRPGGESHFRTTEGPRKVVSHAGARESGTTEFGAAENYGADLSPNHHAAYQGRLGNKPASTSPARERRVPSEGGTMFAPATPGKSRLRPGSTQGDETPDRSPALPRFGDWNEKDPSSGEGFTVIFNNARNEKKTGGPVRKPLHTESPARVDYGDAHKQANHLPPKYASDKKPSIWSCCFQA